MPARFIPEGSQPFSSGFFSGVFFRRLLQPGGQLVQLRPRLVQGPGQLAEGHLDFSQLAVHMPGGGLKGAHQPLVLAPERLHRPAGLGGGGLLQIVGPVPGLALDGAQALPEAGVALGVGLEGVPLGGEPGHVLLQGPQGLQVRPGGGLRLQLLLEPVPLGRQLPDLLPERFHFRLPLLRLLAQGLVLRLQFPLGGGGLFRGLLQIPDHVLLVKPAEGHALKRIILHTAVPSQKILLILAQPPAFYK